MDYGRQCNRESESIKSRELEIRIWVALYTGGAIYIYSRGDGKLKVRVKRVFSISRNCLE